LGSELHDAHPALAPTRLIGSDPLLSFGSIELKLGDPLNSMEKPNDFNCHKSFAALRLMGLATQSQGLGMPSWPIILNRRGPNAEYGF